MESLKNLSYKADFESKVYEEQKDLLRVILTTDVGKETINEIIFNYRVNKLFKRFTQYHNYPNVMHLLKNSRKAQERFLKGNWEYMELNRSLSTWFDGDINLPYSVFISSDSTLICMNSSYTNVLNTISINGITLYRNNNFDFTSYIHSENFNSDNVYLPEQKFKGLVFRSWWAYNKRSDF